MSSPIGAGNRLAVVGLGYVGLPLARAATEAGLSVVGLDQSTRVTQALSDGQSHVDDVTTADVQQMLARGFIPTSDEQVLRSVDVVVICVPTPLTSDGGPDLSAVKAAARTVAANLQPGQLIVLESTTYPGTTEDVLVPLLETSGLIVGRDVNVAYSPERIDPGNSVFGVRNTPKVVGGMTHRCSTRAIAFYSTFVDEVVAAKGLREAEMTKLLENTYRHVNIALVNEMARFCHDLDIDLWDAIRCASTKPFGFEAFFPGPGVGGHCIPIDPNYLSHHIKTNLGFTFRFVELAQEINASMPAYVVQRAQGLLNDRSLPLRGSKILLLGVTYKADIADQRESSARHIALLLRQKGAMVSYHDPLVMEWDLDGLQICCEADLDEAISGTDLVILLQAHSAYRPWFDYTAQTTVLDTRGVLTGPSVVRL